MLLTRIVPCGRVIDDLMKIADAPHPQQALVVHHVCPSLLTPFSAAAETMDPPPAADPTDERMVSALNLALSGRGDAVDRVVRSED